MPVDEEQSSEVVAEADNTSDGSTAIICRFITRLQRMRITHNFEINPATNTKKVIGYLDGPMQTTHKLVDREEMLGGRLTSVWRYQLEKVESSNLQVIQMFEGRMFAQMELPGYAAAVRAQHATLELACDSYLITLLHQFSVQMVAYKNPEKPEILLAHPDMKPILDRFDGLAETVFWCAEDTSNIRLLDKGVITLINFVTWYAENNLEIVAKCALNPEYIMALAKHVTLILQLKAILNDDNVILD